MTDGNLEFEYWLVEPLENKLFKLILIFADSPTNNEFLLVLAVKYSQLLATTLLGEDTFLL